MQFHNRAERVSILGQGKFLNRFHRREGLETKLAQETEEMLSVFDYFINLVKEEKKIGRADVVTAVELNAEQKAKVEQKLLDTTKYETFEMNYSVDTSLIGGMVIRIGDRVVDSSIKTKLFELTRELRKVQI